MAALRSCRSFFATAIVGSTLIGGAAQAGCLHVGKLWSCTEVGGTVMQMYCVGPGPVRSCQEFSRDAWIFIGRHEVLSQVLADAQLSIAAAASARNAPGSAQAGGDQRPAVVGVLRAAPGGSPGGSSTPPALTREAPLPHLPAIPSPPSSSFTRTIPPVASLTPPLSVPNPSESAVPFAPTRHDKDETPAALVPHTSRH